MDVLDREVQVVEDFVCQLAHDTPVLLLLLLALLQQVLPDLPDGPIYHLHHVLPPHVPRQGPFREAAQDND